MTGDGYLEITPVVGTDDQCVPQYFQYRYHLGYHRHITSRDYCLFSKVESSVCSVLVTFSVICIHPTGSAAYVGAATAVIYCVTSLREQTFLANYCI